MHSIEPSMLRCWDGKTKVAAVWNHNTKEPGLCSSEGDCFIYISEEQKQQDSPVFTTSFDKLVNYECQPLIELSTSAVSNCEEGVHDPVLSDVEEIQHTTASSIPSRSIVSLVLTPPSTYNTEQVRDYNVTTRNFFAWIAGLPIVGVTPTVALQALEARMNIWRVHSCDNVTAIQQYAKEQLYDECSGFELYMTYDLQRPDSSPTGQQSVSRRQSFGAFRSRIDKVVKFHQSPKSRFQSERRSSIPYTETNEPPLSADESQILASSDLSEGMHEVMLRSEAMFGKPSTTQLPLDSSVRSRATSDPTSRVDHSSTTSSPNINIEATHNLRDGDLPDLPELDGSGYSSTNDSSKQASLTHNLSEESYNANNTSLPSSPTHREPHRSLSTSSRLRRGSTKRGTSSMQSAPPSPILEEVVIPGKRYPTLSFRQQRHHVRRYSLPPDMQQSSIRLPAATGARSVEAVDKVAWENNATSSSSSPTTSTHTTAAVCKTCKRRKQPAPLGLQHNIETSRDQINDPTIAWNPSRASSSSQVRNIPPLSRQTSGKGKGKVGRNITPQIGRFPSLRRGREISTPNTLPALPRKSAGRGLETTRWSPSSSRACIDRSVTSETEFMTRQISNPKMPRKSTPLAEQRSAASLLSTPSLDQLTPRAVTPVSAVELPASIAKPKELDGSTRKKPNLNIELVPNQATATRPTSAIMLKSDGTEVSMSFTAPMGSPTTGFNTFSIMQRDCEPTPEENNDRVLDQLLNGLRTIESNHQANRNRATYSAKRLGRAPSRPSTMPLFRESSSKLSRPVALKAAKRTSWSGSVRKWKSNHSPSASTATDSSDSSANMSYSSTQPSSVDSKDTLSIRVLTMDKDGKFSTVMVESPTTDSYPW